MGGRIRYGLLWVVGLAQLLGSKGGFLGVLGRGAVCSLGVGGWGLGRTMGIPGVWHFGGLGRGVSGGLCAGGWRVTGQALQGPPGVVFIHRTTVLAGGGGVLFS